MGVLYSPHRLLVGTMTGRGFIDLQLEPVTWNGLTARYSVAETEHMRGLPRREAAFLHELKATFGGEIQDSPSEGEGAGVPGETAAPPAPVFTLVGKSLSAADYAASGLEERVLRLVDQLKRDVPAGTWVLTDGCAAEVDAALRAEAQLVPVRVIPREPEDPDAYLRDDWSLVRDNTAVAAATVVYLLDDGSRARYYERQATRVGKPVHRLFEPQPKATPKRRATKRVER